MAARLPVRIELPGGSVIGTGERGAPAVLVRDEAAFFARIGAGAAGFAESYMAGDWDCADLPGLFAVLASQVHKLLPPRCGRSAAVHPPQAGRGGRHGRGCPPQHLAAL